ncbi:outer membrane protein assembly factor BamE [Phreatobacter stygius]|nr:outer membrane protein assembly factor BamE [Phreatobacter stygius]
MVPVKSSFSKAALLVGAALMTGACSNGPSFNLSAPALPSPPSFTTGETFNRGYVISEEALAQVRPGNSQDQVLVALGTPTTISTISGDVFYYINEKQQRSFMFQTPRTVERNIIAVYFTRERKVERIANYGLQDGKVFDFISRSTTSGGEEASLLRQILQGPRS